MLTEDTPTHRAIFGDEGETVLYFQSANEMVTKARWLVEHPTERQPLAGAAHTRMIEDRHTYQDRLRTMLMLAQQGTYA